MNRKKDFIWAYMLKIGTNMWCDTMPQKWMRYKPEHVHYKMAADHLRCDDALWRDMTEKAAAAGFNMPPVRWWRWSSAVRSMQESQ